MMSNKLFVLSTREGLMVTKERIVSDQIVYCNGLLLNNMDVAIAKALNAHRKEVLFTCPEDCWCWDLEEQAMRVMERAEEKAIKKAEEETVTILNMETAPKQVTVILITKQGLVYSGRYRYGNLGEPQQDICAWRSDCSGRFVEPVGWIPLERIVQKEGL